ncbi:MAG: 1,4-dihydroxy-2-naphthoate polyprenyltransferase [Thermoanaerobacterales bacterium]
MTDRLEDAPPSWRDWIDGARPRTLPAAVVPVLVGTACAAGRTDVVAWRALAAGVVALALQVGTNYANDYSDGVRGTDSGERRVGPVRLVGSGRRPPGAVKRAALAAFGVAAAAGLALVAAVGVELLVVGAAALAAGWFYTGGPHPYGYLGLGEVFVFAFFGVVATAGSAYVQEEALSGLALGASVPVGLLATALLVVNNLRDIPGDTASGKRTLAVRMGDRRTRALYVALVVGALAAVPLVAVLGDRPWAAVALAAAPVAARPVAAVRSGAAGPDLIPVLGATGRLQLALGGLFAAGLWLSA